ncbi:MAG: helix-turn-helix domain-containing protein [Veillonella sp.]
MYIGDFIKEYREANGVSVEDFATKAGLTVTEIEALENNFTRRWYCKYQLRCDKLKV